MVGYGENGGKFNAKMSVCTFHMGMRNIPKTPSSPPIKGCSLLLKRNNTQEKSTKEKEKSNTTPWA